MVIMAIMAFWQNKINVDKPPRIYSGAVVLCFARKGVLRALQGLFLLGGIGIPPPMQHAVRGVLSWFAAVLWYSVFARCVAVLLFPA